MTDSGNAPADPESAPTYIRRDDRVPHAAHVVIDRPGARNSINSEVARQLGTEFERCESDPDVRVIVLSGAPLPDGSGIFSAGLDLKSFAATGDVGEIRERGFAGITERPPSKPVIAAVEGAALAGGFEIALACDMIVAAEDARMGLPEVKRGLVADGGALLRLPERIPTALAMEFALTGDEVPVERLARIGLVNHVVAPEHVVDHAHHLAREIARNAPLALAATKQILAASSRATGPTAWDEQRRIAKPVWTSDDAQEGATAFAEKREPLFRGG